LNGGKVLEYAKAFLQDYRGLHNGQFTELVGRYRAELLRFSGSHFSSASLIPKVNVGT